MNAFDMRPNANADDQQAQPDPAWYFLTGFLIGVAVGMLACVQLLVILGKLK
jgi:hypothetical protein